MAYIIYLHIMAEFDNRHFTISYHIRGFMKIAVPLVNMTVGEKRSFKVEYAAHTTRKVVGNSPCLVGEPVVFGVGMI